MWKIKMLEKNGIKIIDLAGSYAFPEHYIHFQPLREDRH